MLKRHFKDGVRLVAWRHLGGEGARGGVECAGFGTPAVKGEGGRGIGEICRESYEKGSVGLYRVFTSENKGVLGHDVHILILCFY